MFRELTRQSLVALLAIGAVAFSGIIIALLAVVAFDLAPQVGIYHPGQEVRALRLILEMLAVVGATVLTIWTLLFHAMPHGKEDAKR